MKTYWHIPGWFGFPGVYDDAIAAAKSGDTFVEVGCWMGKSTIYMASRIRKSRKKIKLYAVDTFKGSPNEKYMLAIVRQHRGSLFSAFKQNLRDTRVASLVRPIVSTSLKASRKFERDTLSFVFIDACHTYEAVKADIAAWLPKVKQGGILAGHDIGTYSGVAQAVGELLGSVPVKENCWIFVKP